MSAQTQAATTVTSADGTQIAYWTSGDGPPLVLVHGTTGDHNRWAPLLPYLETHATVVTIDRRGRGRSGDAETYHVEREFEDVAAVIDAVADAHGTRVDLYGHSYGALCALGASLLTTNIRKLVLYEPVVGAAPSPEGEGFDRRIDDLVAEGKPEEAVATFFQEVLGMSDDELEMFRAMASWPARVAAAHTIGREARAENSIPDLDRFQGISVPTLMIAGGDSPDFLKTDTDAVAGVLPDVRVVVLEGQEHIADVYAPELFAGHVLAFLRDGE